MNALLSLDFLGTSYHLTYKGNKRSQTLFGVFISICLIGLALASMIVFGKELIDKKEPFVRSTEVFSQDNKITLDQVPLIFTLIHPSGRPLTTAKDFEPFFIHIHYGHLYFDEENNFRTDFFLINTEICSEDNLSPEHWALLQETSGAGVFLCANPSKVMDFEGNPLDQEVFFRNTFGHYDSSYVAITINECDEEKNPGCRGWLAEEGWFYVNRYYLTSYFDLGNYGKPTTKFTNSKVRMYSTNMTLKNYTVFSINELTTDSGVVFKDESTQEFFTIDREYQFIDLKRENKRELAVFYHEVSFIKNNHFRRYLKIQEVLANVGGFLKVSFMVAGIFVKIYSQYAFFVSFRHELWNAANLSKNNLNGTQSGNNSLQRLGNNRKPAIKLSFWQYLVSLVSKKKREKYKVCLEEVNRYFDISYLSCKITEIERQMAQKIENDVLIRMNR